MVPRACTPTNLARDLSSPSSTDLIDVAALSNPMGKRPLDSSVNRPHQPTKRERRNGNTSGEDNDVVDPKLPQAGSLLASIHSVYEYASYAWGALKAKDESATGFRHIEIMSVAEERWTQLQLPEKEIAKLRRDMKRQFKKGGLFKKAERSDGLPEFYVMMELAEVKKLLSTREAGKKGDGRRADTPSGADDDDDVILCGTIISRNVNRIPEEWTAEAFKPVRLSLFDKSPGISFVGDSSENVVKGHKGYRMIRATSGVLEGDWYFESEILPRVKGNVRLGWSMRRSDIETPVGFDPYGFGIRDLTGEFLHRARPKPYGERFGVGDIIGCRILLPPLTDEQKQHISEAEERWLKHRFISNLQGPQPPDSDIDLSPHGKIEFFKNGKSMGIPAFFTDPQPPMDTRLDGDKNKNLPNGELKEKGLRRNSRDATLKKCMKGGVYYPSIALFGDAVVKANFGPQFKFPVPEGSQPMCEAAREAPPPEKKADTQETLQEAPETENQKDEQGNHASLIRQISTPGTVPKATSPGPQLGEPHIKESHSLPEYSNEEITNCLEITCSGHSSFPSTGPPTL